MRILTKIMESRTISPRKRQKVFERDGFRCVNCGKTKEYAQLEADHIITIANGGTNDIENLQTLCYECNLKKKQSGIKGEENSLSKFSPIDKLNLIKDKIKEYSNLNWNEFKIVYVLDTFFRKIGIPRDDIHEIFLELTGKKEEVGENSKYKAQRDLLIWLFRKYTKLKYRDIDKILEENSFSISFQQISKICSKFGDIDIENNDNQ